MGGIFGVFIKENACQSSKIAGLAMRDLFQQSEMRGKDTSGLACWMGNTIFVHKAALSASRLLASRDYQLFEKFFARAGDRSLSLIGHCRPVNSGIEFEPCNNQPVVKNSITAVHDGTVTNHEQLWALMPGENRRYGMDAEVLSALASFYRECGNSTEEAWQKTFATQKGSANIAAFHADSGEIILASNNGSLYYLEAPSSGCVFFASEGYFLKNLAALPEINQFCNEQPVINLSPGTAVRWGRKDLEKSLFSLTQESPQGGTRRPVSMSSKVIDIAELNLPSAGGLRRCTKCLLPETYPFIEFDEAGVCNVCRSFTPVPSMGREELLARLKPYRKDNGDYDCLVGLSGGRDSCYGLHYLKKVLGMNPVAFTYDWGMGTNLALRNMSRMCGKLGVELITISADIRKKRDNIRRNVEAWLHQPDLGIIPLFMAGDKQFYAHANILMEKMHLGSLVFCENAKFEKTSFKSGFCGIRDVKIRAYDIQLLQKIKMVVYYLSRFIKNPRYLNRSIVDTFTAFHSTYVLKHDYFFLFDYIDWNEEEIISTLVNEYEWELASDTENTWRIGDGTAAFYNYIYYTIAGFTENDAFRSNQIRYGVISRDEGMRLAARDNRLRAESMQWYANTIGFDLAKAIQVINNAPRLYKTVDLETLLAEAQ